MGSDPKTSALNRYLQSWDVSNVFVVGANAFPQNNGYNPTVPAWADCNLLDRQGHPRAIFEEPRAPGAGLRRAPS